MGNRRFFDRPSGLTIADIAALTGAEASGAVMSHVIKGVAPADLAGPSDLAFIDANKFIDALTKTRAGACLMPKRFIEHAPKGLIVLQTEPEDILTRTSF